MRTLTARDRLTVRRARTSAHEELNARANLADYLRGQGTGCEELVAICCQRSPDLLVALLAVLKAGAAYIPLEPSDPSRRLGTIIQDARPRIVLADQAVAHKLAGGGHPVILLEDVLARAAAQPESNLQVRSAGDQLAYVMYTSGSTGQPKGVMVTRSGLANYLSWCIDAYGIEDGSGAPVHSSVAFDLTITSLYGPLDGRTVFLLPEVHGCRLGRAARRIPQRAERY